MPAITSAIGSVDRSEGRRISTPTLTWCLLPAFYAGYEILYQFCSIAEHPALLVRVRFAFLPIRLVLKHRLAPKCPSLLRVLLRCPWLEHFRRAAQGRFRKMRTLFFHRTVPALPPPPPARAMAPASDKAFYTHRIFRKLAAIPIAIDFQVTWPDFWLPCLARVQPGPKNKPLRWPLVLPLLAPLVPPNGS
jgi:hypothetical protein